MNTPIAPVNFIIVQTEKNREKKDYLKHGNLELELDPEYNPSEVHKEVWGTVASLPRTNKWEYNIGTTKIPFDVGDKLFFHYNAIDPLSRIEIGDEIFFRIAPPNIIFYLKGEKIHPVSGWTLCEPIKKQTEFKAGIVAPPQERDHDEHKAVLSIIGDKIEGFDANPGDVIQFKDFADFENAENKIFDKKYFFISQQDILGRWS